MATDPFVPEQSGESSTPVDAVDDQAEAKVPTFIESLTAGFEGLTTALTTAATSATEHSANDMAFERAKATRDTSAEKMADSGRGLLQARTS